MLLRSRRQDVMAAVRHSHHVCHSAEVLGEGQFVFNAWARATRSAALAAHRSEVGELRRRSAEVTATRWDAAWGERVSLEVFLRWVSLAEGEVLCRRMAQLKSQHDTALDASCTRLEMSHHAILLSSALRSWSSVLAIIHMQTTRASARHLLLIAHDRTEGAHLGQCFFSWAGAVAGRLAHDAECETQELLRANARLHIFARCQLLQHLVFLRWAGFIARHRDMHAEAVHARGHVLGICEGVLSHRIGQLEVLAQLQTSWTTWLRHCGFAGGSHALRKRDALDKLLDLLSGRIITLEEAAAAAAAWYIWAAIWRQSALSAAACARAAEDAHRDFLLGSTLLVWGQEHMRNLLGSILWSWRASAAQRNYDAAVGAFHAEISLLEHGGRLERRHALHEIERLAGHIFQGAIRDRLVVGFLGWQRSTSIRRRAVRDHKKLVGEIDQRCHMCMQHAFGTWRIIVLVCKCSNSRKHGEIRRLRVIAWGFLAREVLAAWHGLCASAARRRSPAGRPAGVASCDSSPSRGHDVESPSLQWISSRTGRPLVGSPDHSRAGGSGSPSADNRMSTVRRDNSSRTAIGSRVIAAAPAPAVPAVDRQIGDPTSRDAAAALLRARAMQASAIVERSAMDDVEARYSKTVKVLRIVDAPTPGALVPAGGIPPSILRSRREVAGA